MKKIHINLFGAVVGILLAVLMNAGPMAIEMASAYFGVTLLLLVMGDTVGGFVSDSKGGQRADADPSLADVVTMFKDANTELTKRQKGIDDANKLVMDKLEKREKLDIEHQEKIDAQITSINEQKAVLVDLQQKMDELSKTGLKQKERPTIRSAIAAELKRLDSGTLEKLSRREGRTLRLDLKEVVMSTTNGAVGLLAEPYIDTLISMPQQPLSILQLLTIIPVTSDSVKYGKQNVRVNNAAIVPEGTQKPYSNYGWDMATASIETIAHLAKLTLQAIADAPRLQAEVESEMRFGLALAVEREVLSGDGTTNHLNGLTNQATPYAVPAGVLAGNILTTIDQLRIAQLQLAIQYYAPDGQVLNPIDWANIELLRDGENRYLFTSGPQSQVANKQLWGLPVVESPSMTYGQFLVGAFKQAVHLYQREGVTALISTENDTDFEMNLATMRVEQRLGLAVRIPQAIVKGTFLTGAGS